MIEPIQLTQVTSFIATEADDEALERIGGVIQERRKALVVQEAAKVVVGADVKIVNIKPAALKGKFGRVASIGGRYADVELTEASTEDLRWERTSRITVPKDVKQYTVTGVPLTCLRVQ